MNFHLFVQHYNYPINQKKVLLCALGTFFKSARMRPYTDAISRSNDDEQRDRCINLVKAFSDEFMAYLASQDELLAFAQSLDTPSNPLDHLKGFLFEGLLRKTLFWKFSSKLNEIQEKFIIAGTLLLENEHHLAIQTLDKDRLCSFEEYYSEAWANARVANDVMTPTAHQWHGYLNYIMTLILPFASGDTHTENKRKSLQFIDKMDAACHKIDKASSVLHKASACYDRVEVEIKSVMDQLFEEKIADNADNGHSPDSDPNALVAAFTAFVLYDPTYRELRQYRSMIQKKIATISTLFSDHNGLNRDSPLVQAFTPELNYWSENLPRSYMRFTEIKAIANYTPPSKGNDIVYRYISNKEYGDLLKTQQFNQSPEHSFEREKWFFYEGADPGNGVTHALFCKIYIKKGALRCLLDLQKPDGQFAGVVKKENEACCLGIHEDALSVFNDLVEKVEIQETKSKKALKTIRFPGNNEITVARENVQVTSSLFSLFQTKSNIVSPDIQSEDKNWGPCKR